MDNLKRHFSRWTHCQRLVAFLFLICAFIILELRILAIHHTIIWICPSVRPSVPHLLGRIWTDCIQTRQEGQGRDPAGAKGIGFHSNQTVVMVFNKNCPRALILEWLCWNSQCPIYLAIWICMQKMSVIHQVVHEDYFMGFCTASIKFMLPPLNWSPR